MIEDFLKDIDSKWKRKERPPLPFKVIGGASLVLQYDYSRPTKDTDLIEVKELTEDIKKRLKRIAGKDSLLHRKHRLYIDIVNRALPFLPPNPMFYPLIELNKELVNFRVEALDVVDVLVSKMTRFSSTDVDDFKAMIDLGVVDPVRLEKRFMEAFEAWTFEARAEKLPKIIENLHFVQRDMLLVEESMLSLPRWME